MAERKIRQADLDALRAELTLAFHEELNQKLWLLAKIFAVPLTGATVKGFELLRLLTDRLANGGGQ